MVYYGKDGRILPILWSKLSNWRLQDQSAENISAPDTVHIAPNTVQLFAAEDIYV